MRSIAYRHTHTHTSHKNWVMISYERHTLSHEQHFSTSRIGDGVLFPSITSHNKLCA